MNNDLISREALKGDFKSRLALCNEWIEKAKDKETKIRASAVKAVIAEVIMTIDNAPTIKQRDNFDLGYIQGLEDGKNERPQVKCENCDLYFKAMTKEEMKKGEVE